MVIYLKIRLLQEFKDDAEIIISINTADIEKNKVRGDLGITYEQDTLRLIDAAEPRSAVHQRHAGCDVRRHQLRSEPGGPGAADRGLILDGVPPDQDGAQRGGICSQKYRLGAVCL